MLTQQRSYWLLAAITLVAFMVNIDYTAVNLALVNMATDLHTNLDAIRWVLGAYVLAWAAVVIPAGKWLDRFGLKRVFITGLGLFMGASLMAGLANSVSWVIAGRVVQGLAGALYVPALYAMIHACFPTERRGMAIGILSIGVGFGMALGPSIGGLIVSLMSWRWIFLLNVPICLIALVVISKFASHLKSGQTEVGMHKPSAILLSLGLVLLMYAVGQVQYSHLNPPMLDTLLTTSVLCIVFFIWWQRRLKTPLIPASLFRNKPYMGTVMTFCIEQYAFSSIIIVVALYLQEIMGHTALIASLIFLGLNLVFGVIAPFGGKIVDQIGVRSPAMFGLLILAIGCLAFAFLPVKAPIWMVLFLLMLMGFGMGFAFSSLNTGMVNTLNSDDVGIGSSLFLMFALLGNTLGVIVTTTVYQIVAAKELLVKAHLWLLKLTSTQSDQLHQAAAQIGQRVADFSAFPVTGQEKLQRLLLLSLNDGLLYAMLVTAILLFAAVVIAQRMLSAEGKEV